MAQAWVVVDVELAVTVVAAVEVEIRDQVGSVAGISILLVVEAATGDPVGVAIGVVGVDVAALDIPNGLDAGALRSVERAKF